MNFEWTISAGQLLVISVPIVSTAGAIVLGFLFNKWQKATLVEVDTKITAAISDTNGRLTRYAEGASALRTEVTEFKAYADKHYVEVGDLAEVKASFQASMSDLRDDVRTATATMGDVRTATATMGDVRDAVIAMTATGGKPTVPPARRRATKVGS